MEREVEAECESLRKSLKEKGDTLMNLVLGKAKKDRYILREAYKSCFGVDLEEDVNKHLSGNFRRVIIDLFRPAAERDAIYLYKAMKGAGTDEDTIVEILCSRPSVEIQKIKEEYKRLYKGDELEKKVKKDTSGALQKLLISQLQCNRSENSVPDEAECTKLAETLFKAGEGKLGTDEETFNKIFSLSSPPELFSINSHYSALTGHSLKESVEKEYSGNIKEALIAILESTISPTEYFAKRIYKSVKGLGTNDKMLIRNLATREGIDMKQIRESYKNLFNQDMIEDIKNDTSGIYQKMVIALASRD